MAKTPIRGIVKFCVAMSMLTAVQPIAPGQIGGPKTVLDTPNPSGVLRTIALNGNRLDHSNPFFQSLGANGRSCVSCHVPSAGWSITPSEVKARFTATSGLDPIFRTNDGSNTPKGDVSTVAKRRKAYSMLLEKGLIRVGLPIPEGAEFKLIAVDDPYGYASAAELSLFRRPLPTTNLKYITTLMWDGRESFSPNGTFPILSDATPDQNALALFLDLKHQADDATTGHAEGPHLTDAQATAIVDFELNLITAQQVDRGAGSLDAHGARGGPLHVALQPFYVTINDVLGADVITGRFDPVAMTLYEPWRRSRNPEQSVIARGAAIFNTRTFAITEVGGLNDDLGISAIRGTCTSCHDTPNIGNHSVALPINIGLSDARRRTPDMPLYTLRNVTTGEARKTTDPGRALITGRWRDIGKFKGPVLRGLSARPPYFHNGFAADLEEVVEFYDARFRINFTDREKSDLVAFLKAL